MATTLVTGMRPKPISPLFRIDQGGRHYPRSDVALLKALEYARMVLEGKYYPTRSGRCSLLRLAVIVDSVRHPEHGAAVLRRPKVSSS